MRFEQLKYVAAVAEYGSMNQAGEALHVSQQNISKAIRQLEEELGVAIFVRTNKGVVLTMQGERLQAFILEQLEKMEKLKVYLHQEQLRLMEGKITLATMNTGSSMILPQMVCAFYRDYPRVQLEICDGMVEEVMALVQTGRAQVGIITFARMGARTYPVLPQGLRFEALLVGRNYYWVSRLSPLARKQSLTFAEVAAQPVLLYEQMDQAFLQEMYAHFGYQPHVALRSKNLYLLGQLTAENYGLLPDLLLESDESMYQYVFQNQPQAVAIPLQEYADLQVAIGYIVRADSERRGLFGHLLDFLEREGACRGKGE